MRAHTATHLLHQALNMLLWSTKQAWSLVDEDYLRFDFAANSPLNDNELSTLEQYINQRIRAAAPVETTEMSYDEATATGAKAFFEDKYGDVVRVVRIVHEWTTLHSIELCGGTHVHNTQDIGAFIILAQEAVASGIRRIVAVTWPAVADHAIEQRAYIAHLAQKLDCQPKQLEEKIDKLNKNTDELERKYEKLQTRYFMGILTHISAQKSAQKWVPSSTTELADMMTYIVNLSAHHMDDEDLKSFLQLAKQERKDVNFLLYTASWSYALASWAAGTSAKELVQKLGIKGWWNDQLMQWKDPRIVALADTKEVVS